jgi:hypothetical protein
MMIKDFKPFPTYPDEGVLRQAIAGRAETGSNLSIAVNACEELVN